MNKLVFVCPKTRKHIGPKHFGAIFGRDSFSKSNLRKPKVFGTAPQIVPNCPTMILRKCSGWSCEFELESHFGTQLYCYKIFFRASNCTHKIFFFSCAVFLGFYNVLTSCHLSCHLNGCSI